MTNNNMYIHSKHLLQNYFIHTSMSVFSFCYCNMRYPYNKYNICLKNNYLSVWLLLSSNGLYLYFCLRSHDCVKSLLSHYGKYEIACVIIIWFVTRLRQPQTQPFPFTQEAKRTWGGGEELYGRHNWVSEEPRREGEGGGGNLGIPMMQLQWAAAGRALPPLPIAHKYCYVRSF